MIIRTNKGYETNSLFPDVDWYNNGNYIIDETTEEGIILVDKIKSNYPHYDLVVVDGVLTDVTVYPTISLTADKTTIQSDGVDTATITSDVPVSFYDEEGTLLDVNVTSLTISSINTGTIIIEARSDKYKPSTIEIEVM